jgi:ABC-2 type transport system permease protein
VNKMKNLSDMSWIELRKAFRSKMPLFTALGSLFMPLGIAFMLFVSKNPEISRKLGLISTKATLMADTFANWPTYLTTFAQILSIGVLILAVLIISWVFGREFTDGTLKDLLAVPVSRGTILMAKFIVVAVWSAALAALIFGAGLAIGGLFQLTGGTITILREGCRQAAITTALAIAAGLPFAFFTSLGRGSLLPIGVLILTLIMANLVTAAGWGEYFPWAVLGLYAQGQDPLPTASFVSVGLVGLIGVAATYFWWKYADQNH